MGDLSEWLSLVWDGLFAAWLVAAIFWAIAGVAAASWANINVALGGVIGAATLFLGCAGILLFGAAKRHRANGSVFDDQPDAGSLSTRPNGSLPGVSDLDQGSFGRPGLGQSGFGETGLGQSGFGQSGFGETGLGQPGFGEPRFGAAETTANTQEPESAARRASGAPTIVALSVAGAVTAGFAAAIFAPWLTLGFGVEIDGTEVAFVPLLCTVLCVAGAAALSWRGPRRLPALVVAWFSSWWLLIGILALTSGGQLADTITAVGNQAVTRLSLDTELAGYSTVTIGTGVTLVAVAGLLGVLWGATAVVRCAAGSAGWSQ